MKKNQNRIHLEEVGEEECSDFADENKKVSILPVMILNGP